MAQLEFRTLRADEIEVRVGQKKKDGTKQSLLLYKDARCDMALLDEVVGAMNWKREHTRDNANCIVSIWDREKAQWVSKEDTGTESNTEKEKGLASDSFKRACFNWGIGRELYTAPQIWVGSDVSPYELHVSFIHYNANREIDGLTIVDKKGGVLFNMKGGSQAADPTPTATPAMDAAKAKPVDGRTKLLLEIQNCKTAIELQGIQARLDAKQMADKSREEWQKRINERGGELNATRTPDGWVFNGDLFQEEQ